MHKKRDCLNESALDDVRLGNWRRNSESIRYAIRMVQAAKELCEAGKEIPKDCLNQFGGIRGQFDIDDPIRFCVYAYNSWREKTARSSKEKTARSSEEATRHSKESSTSWLTR